MYRTILLHHPNVFVSSRSRIFHSRKRGLRIPLKTGVMFAFVACIVSGFIMYLVLTNSIVRDIFGASEYRKTLQGLEEENRRLGIEFARLNSYSALLERSRQLNMVAASGLDHLEVSDDSFAFVESPPVVFLVK